mgnify:CR=1 FL=1|tara:strand:- start:156 stop:971 length:816 start_codon:yes stop_codon:yes gene_type:complete
MRNKYSNYILKLISLIVVSGFVLLGACKKCEDPKNPECPNYNPCVGKELSSARFKMLEGFDYRGQHYWEDSIFMGYQIYFNSELNEEQFEHTWYVGADVFHSQNALSMRFDNVPRPADIDITHVINYEPNLTCFPDDDGYDSIVQTVHLIKRWDELATYGTFRGVIDNQLDSFEMSFFNGNNKGKIIDDFASNSQYSLIINFHNQGDTINTYDSQNQYGVPLVVNRHGIFYDRTAGTIEVLADNSVEMRYKINYNILQDSAWHVFRGRKVN